MRGIAAPNGMGGAEEERVGRCDHCLIAWRQECCPPLVCRRRGQRGDIEIAATNVLRAIPVRLVNLHRHTGVIAADEGPVDPYSPACGEVDADQSEWLTDRHPMKGITLTRHGGNPQYFIFPLQESRRSRERRDP